MATTRTESPELVEMMRAAARGAAEGGEYRERLVRLETTAAAEKEAMVKHIEGTEKALENVGHEIKAGAKAQTELAKQVAEFIAKSSTMFGLGSKVGQGVFGIVCAVVGAVIIKAFG